MAERKEAFKDWAPRDCKGLTMEQHQAKMHAVGDPNSKLFYINPVIMAVFSLIWLVFTIWAPLAGKDGQTDMRLAQTWITDVWNWMYIVSQNIWVCVLVYLCYYYWDLRLGKDDDPPMLSDAAWFAMIFSCGVATGLWYFSAEAMWHYECYGTPRWADKQMFNQNTQAEYALMVTFYHWGVHGWIPYVCVGAMLAIMTYRRGFPMSMRFCIYPVAGEMCYGFFGDMMEVLSMLCTIFGMATSLGLGVMQIAGGMIRLDQNKYKGIAQNGDGNLGLEKSKTTFVLICVVITLLSTLSLMCGLEKGMKIVSLSAFFLSTWLTLCILFMDETYYILNAICSAMGYYIWCLPKISMHTDAFEELGHKYLGGSPDGRGGKRGWMDGWTIFYWGWWISWGPFVGTFIARISKGRRLGPMIVASLILPSLWAFFFLGTFGAAQIRITNLAKAHGLGFGTTAAKGYSAYGDGFTRLYAFATEDVLFEHFNVYGGEGFTWFFSFLGLVAIILYFITSSDSASFVNDILAANGREEPPWTQRMFWGLLEGVSTCVLLLAADEDDPQGTLNALKPVPIILGLPFTFLLFYVCQSLLIACKEEVGMMPIERKNFRVWNINAEPWSFISFLAPFIPMGNIANKLWPSLPAPAYMAAYGALWFFAIILEFIALADEIPDHLRFFPGAKVENPSGHSYYPPAKFKKSKLGVVDYTSLYTGTNKDEYETVINIRTSPFSKMGIALYLMMGFILCFLRNAVRMKLNITGDFISDAVYCVVAFPFAVGQVHAELPHFDDIGPKLVTGGNIQAKAAGAGGNEKELAPKILGKPEEGEGA